MEIFSGSLLLISALFILLGLGVWIAVSLIAVGMIGMLVFTSAPVGKLLATTIWGQSSDWSLTALPLFIWMGSILFRTRLSEDMFTGLAPWLRQIPGRLLHVNVIGSGIFAAATGSSTATAVTIGRITIPELRKRGYDDRMLLGSLAGTGTLGMMIPPSIIMIVYGVAANVSVARMFIAGILPGLVLVVLFSFCIMVYAKLNPSAIPTADAPLSFREKLFQTRKILPVFLLILIVIGSIYGGFATATEAAAIGVFGALLFSATSGTLSISSFRESLLEATETSCMLAFIIAGAAFTTLAMGFSGIPRVVSEFVVESNLSPAMIIISLTLIYLLLGLFLDGISMIVLTLPVVMPMIYAAGIDPIWFGIYLVVVVEMATITPPVGFNLFVIQSLANRSVMYVSWGAMPFFFTLLFSIWLLWIFPSLATFLPSVVFGRS